MKQRGMSSLKFLIGLLGICAAVIGLGQLGVMLNRLGTPGKVLFIVVSFVVILVMLVELKHWIIILIELPFFIFSYVFFLPIKKKKGAILHGRNPVIAYWIRPDRVVLVCHLFIPDYMNTIAGTSVFRGPRKLTRMREILDSANVPEHPLNEKRLREAVAVWNQDSELRHHVCQRLQGRSGDELLPSEPLIVLDTHSREHIDRIVGVLDFLWKSKKYRDVRDDIIQLAIWHSFAVDVCYGKETQGILDREFA